MSINSDWNQLLQRFRDKEYRDLFVAEQIFSRLPLKIRALRDDRNLTQTRLGEIAGMKQTWVSKLEDPNYGKLTISTLLKVASAFDVGLYIDFVSFSEVLDRTLRLTSNSFSVPSYQDDPGLKKPNEVANGLLQAPEPRAAGNRPTIVDISGAAGFVGAQREPAFPIRPRTSQQGELSHATVVSSAR